MSEIVNNSEVIEPEVQAEEVPAAAEAPAEPAKSFEEMSFCLLYTS